MKKIILNLLIMIIFIFVLFNNTFGHKQPTHQYIVREAYTLLKKHFSFQTGDLPEMNAYIGNTEGRNAPWKYYLTIPLKLYPKIVSGAWQEDDWDIVYKKGDFGIRYEPFLGRLFLASISHFWNPDLNKNQVNNIIIHSEEWNIPWPFYPIPPPPFVRSHNAYDKNKAYLFNSEDNNYYWEFNYNFNQSHTYRCAWNGLLDFYLTGFLRRKAISNFWPYLEGPWENNTEPDDVKYGVCYNILGRACHLLGDMSVPSHVDLDEHSVEEIYEIFMDIDEHNFFQNWNGLNTHEDRGDLINPFCGSAHGQDLIEYLMYTTAQITQYFGGLRHDGNNNYNQSIGEIKSILQSYAPSSPTGNYQDNYTPPFQTLLDTRDVTTPYIIRSTAGLLYWWIISTKQLRPNNEGTLCDQQIHLSLYDQTLNGDHYTYQASIGSTPYTSYEQVHKGEIEICPTSSSGDFIITSRAKNVTFKAADHIIIKPGFSALAGSDVHLYIAPCSECPDEDYNPQYNR